MGKDKPKSQENSPTERKKTPPLERQDAFYDIPVKSSTVTPERDKKMGTSDEPQEEIPKLQRQNADIHLTEDVHASTSTTATLLNQIGTAETSQTKSETISKPSTVVTRDAKKLHPYDFENLKHSNAEHIKIDGYGTGEIGSYIYFNYHDPSKHGKASPDRRAMFAAKHEHSDVGWKLHISVDPKDLPDAWSIIRPILMKNHIDYIKIIDPDVMARHTKTETNKNEPIPEGVLGKQVTIYLHENTNVDNAKWQEIMLEIETELQQSGIKPGTFPPANKQVQDSQYFSYRNDTHPETHKYINDTGALLYAEAKGMKASEAYNLTHVDDIFKDLSLINKLKPNLF